MRATLALALGLLAIAGGPSAAQEASVRETRCWVGDIAFSAGAAINAGDQVAVCRAGTGWTKAEVDTPVAGCLLEGKLSSAGAVVGVRNSDSVLLQCDASGRWVTLKSGTED